MHIALLIGVGEYTHNQINNLPACKADLEIMTNLIKATNKYDDILSLYNNESAIVLKSKIADWIDKLKGSNIEEFFFYYTGHGEFYNNEYYYILHDFSPERRNQSSLLNSDLDDWLRSLAPEFTTKVVDACNSGVEYIKTKEILEKHLKHSKEQFNRCIFMFSSNNEQYSYQDKYLSYFTKSFVDAIKKHQTSRIRYIDIEHYIADEFDGNDSQTPFIVKQASSTQIFCTVSESIRALEYPQPPQQEVIDIHIDKENKLTLHSDFIKLIEDDEKKIVTEEQAIHILNNIERTIREYTFGEDFNQLFNLEITLLNSVTSISSIEDIGYWLEETEHDFFATPTYKVHYIEQKQEKHRFDTILGLNRLFEDINPVVEEIDVLSGFKHTFETPYHAIRLLCRPKFDNIRQYYCPVTYLVSNRAIRFYFYFAYHKKINWEKLKLVKGMDWKINEVLLSKEEKVQDVVVSLLRAFESYCIDDIQTNLKHQIS